MEALPVRAHMPSQYPKVLELAFWYNFHLPVFATLVPV